jgi:hypothetical protein
MIFVYVCVCVCIHALVYMPACMHGCVWCGAKCMVSKHLLEKSEQSSLHCGKDNKRQRRTAFLQWNLSVISHDCTESWLFSIQMWSHFLASNLILSLNPLLDLLSECFPRGFPENYIHWRVYLSLLCCLYCFEDHPVELYSQCYFTYMLHIHYSKFTLFCLSAEQQGEEQ